MPVSCPARWRSIPRKDEPNVIAAVILLRKHFPLRATSAIVGMLYREDVLYLRYSEQPRCFMVLPKWPIGGHSSMLTKSGKSLKTGWTDTPPSGISACGWMDVLHFISQRTLWLDR